MHQAQLAKAAIEHTELEYRFDDDLWLPAIISQYHASNAHSPNITLQLLRYPNQHSGVIYLNSDDINNRLRLKGEFNSAQS